jgi:hypothetical protein
MQAEIESQREPAANEVGSNEVGSNEVGADAAAARTAPAHATEASASGTEATPLTTAAPPAEQRNQPRMFGGVPLPMPGALLAEPTGKRLLWIGGLGAMVTIGLLEWPVAVAVGAGSYVAERLARDSAREQVVRRAEQAPAPPRS